MVESTIEKCHRRSDKRRNIGRMMMTRTTARALEAASQTTVPTKKETTESLWLRLLRRWGTIVVIALTAIGFSFASPYFFNVSNFNNILFSMIVSCLVSIGLTFVVVGG